MGAGGGGFCSFGIQRYRYSLPTPYNWGAQITRNEAVVSFQIYGHDMEFHNYVCSGFGLDDQGTYTNIFERLDLFTNFAGDLILVDKEYEWFHPDPRDVATAYSLAQYLFEGSIFWDYYGTERDTDFLLKLFVTVKHSRESSEILRTILYPNLLFRRLLKLFFVREVLDYATDNVSLDGSPSWRVRLGVGMNIDYGTGQVYDVTGILGRQPYRLIEWPVGGRVIKRFSVYFSHPGDPWLSWIEEVNFWVRGKKFPISTFYNIIPYSDRLALINKAEEIASVRGFPFYRNLIPQEFLSIQFI